MAMEFESPQTAMPAFNERETETDAKIDATMRETMDRIDAREKAGASDDLDSYRANAMLERREATKRGEWSDDNLLSTSMLDTMRGAADRIHDPARVVAQDENAPITMPPSWGSNETAEAYLEWDNLPRDDQKSIREAYDQQQGRRESAAKLGLTVEELDRRETLNLLREGATFQKDFGTVMPRLQALEPSQSAAQNATRLTELAEGVLKHPQGVEAGYRWLGEQLGLKPQQLQVQPQAKPASSQVDTAISTWWAQNPAARPLAQKMNEAFDKGIVRITGNVAKDFGAALEYARKAA